MGSSRAAIRVGAVHLRLWLAERLVDELGATSWPPRHWSGCTPLLGCRVGPDVDLHSIPPVTGLLTLGAGCSVEPEVDLAGHWLDGGHLHVGAVDRCRRPRRCPQHPPAGADVGERAEVAPGSAVFGTVPAGQAWSGRRRRTRARPVAPGGASDREPAGVAGAYAASAVALSLLPVTAVGAGTTVALSAVTADSPGEALLGALAWVPLGSGQFVVLAVLVLVVVRVLSSARAGHHPVHGLRAWQAWSVLRVMDEARTRFLPIYPPA